MSNHDEGYTIIPNRAMGDNRLLDGAKLCHMYLLSKCYGDKLTCYPSVRDIAEYLGKSMRTITRYIKLLVELGYITRTSRIGTSNLYTLLKKRIVEKVQEVIKSAKKTYNSNWKQKKESVFNNFDQRTYDYDDLEKKLLGWAKK